MRTPEQVAGAVVARVVEATSLGSPLDGKVWKNAIIAEVVASQKEWSTVVGRAILKVKSIKARQREALAAELDAALGAK